MPSEQAKDLSQEQHLLGSSEVLESLLGKYKRIPGTHSADGMTGALLNIGAVVLEKTASTIQKAMGEVSIAAVGRWVRDTFGLTLPAQQAFAFRRNNNEPETTTS